MLVYYILLIGDLMSVQNYDNYFRSYYFNNKKKILERTRAYRKAYGKKMREKRRLEKEVYNKLHGDRFSANPSLRQKPLKPIIKINL